MSFKPSSEWGKFFRDNFDKLLLCVIFVFTTLLVVHLSHDSMDHEQIIWAREITGTVLGALLGLITGHAIWASKIHIENTDNAPAEKQKNDDLGKSSS